MRMVKEVKSLGQYRLDLLFDDGVRGTVDLSDLVGKSVFALWRDQEAFERVDIGSSGGNSRGMARSICARMPCT